MHVAMLVSSLLLGFYFSTYTFSSLEIIYVSAFQNWVLQNHLMLFFEVITYAGDAFVWIIIIGLFLLVERRSPRRAFKMLIFIIAISFIDYLLKAGFGRPRPFVAFPSKVQVIVPEGMSSYPSGHLTRLGGESYFIRNGKARSSMLAILIVLLSLSRVALGVHYFTDTLGGFMVSYSIAALGDHLGIYDRILSMLEIKPFVKTSA